MKKFEQLHIDDQNRLLITVLELVAGDEGNSVAKIAAARGVDAIDVWRNICADTGLDECEPWARFPSPPAYLPPAPGGERKLPEAAIAALSKIAGPRAN